MGYVMVFAGGSTREQVSVESLDFVFKPGAGVTVTDDEKKPWNVAAYLYQVFWQAEKDPESEGRDPHRWDRRPGRSAVRTVQLLHCPRGVRSHGVAPAGSDGSVLLVQLALR